MKVIIMSAWHGSEIKEMIDAKPGNFYIEKPFDMCELKQVIQTAFKKSIDQYKERLIDVKLKDIVEFNVQKNMIGV